MLGILLLLISAAGYTQFYEYGQDAGRLKWNKFTTPHYKVIYPRGIDSLAHLFADRLEYYYPHLGQPLGHLHRPIPVIIHNESSFSNGVFVWAPKRLEIFTNPDPNGTYQDWLTQLALHEGRHAVQIDKLDQGITRALSYLGGQQVVGAVAGFLPYWYLEGDAVDAETRLSRTGRGRQPSFEMGLKAQMLGGDKVYSYSKATMGSYKDFIPNHYQLGYLMIRHGRRTYGDSLWIDFQQYAARKPYLISPTFFSMRPYGIRSKPSFYREALHAYRRHWEEESARRIHTPFRDWNTDRTRHYTSFTFPHFVSPSMLFAYKSGIDQIPEFVFLGEQGEEERIFRPGFLSSGRVSFSGSHVVWDEFVPDLRWSNRNFSIIRTYDLSTGEVRNLGRKTRYYSPAVSSDGSRIAAIEQSVGQQYSLVILSIEGEVEQEIPSPGNLFIQHPSWMENDSAILVSLADQNGKALYVHSLSNGKWNQVFHAGVDDISFPVVHGERIYFSGTFSGIDNIYCYDLRTREAFQVTSSRFGAFYPRVSGDGERLAFSEYTEAGYSAVTMNLDQALLTPLAVARNHSEQIDYEPTPGEAAIINGAEQREQSVDTVRNPPSPYVKALHLFNFHSWLPLYFDYLNPELSFSPEEFPLSPGVSLVSQNRLSTAVSQLGYEYHRGDHLFHTGIQLKGRFPVVNLSFRYGGEPDGLNLAEGDTLRSLPPDLRFNVQSFVPLRLNTGKFLSLVQPRIDYTFRRDVQYIAEENRYRQGAHYLYYSFVATSYLRQGRKDIQPRLGATLSAGYYHAPFSQVYGAVSRTGLTAYLPGPLKHQTLRLSVNHQRQYLLDPDRPAFINLMGLPRGLYGIFGEELTRYSADYVFPLLYPDLELNLVLYLKRIRGAIWIDHMAGKNVIIRDPQPFYDERNYTTIGFDLVTDLHLLRISFPLSIGARIFYEPDSGAMGIEAIYSVEID